MLVRNIDFNDELFVEGFINFCVFSKALHETEFGSLESRRLNALRYLDQLKSSDISIYCESNDKDSRYYFFFDRHEDVKKLYISFCFPEQKTLSYKTMAMQAYECCLKAIDISKLETIYSEVRRRKKLEPMLLVIRRFAKAFEIKKGSNGSLGSIQTNKQKLTNGLKKLQI
jgi:hypothetical protein